MKTHVSGDRLVINLRTDNIGGTATKTLETPDTEVYFGYHAEVTLKDLGIVVEMDPTKGTWDYEKLARAKAFEAITPHVREWLPQLLKLNRERGEVAGRNQIRVAFVSLMECE